MGGVVTAVSRSAGHTLIKPNGDIIRLLAGRGVEGDAHSGRRGQASLAGGARPEPAQSASGAPDPRRAA